MTTRLAAGECSMNWSGKRVMTLCDKNGITRALLMFDQDGTWWMLGPLATSLPIVMKNGTNKLKLQRSMEKLLKEIGY